MELSAIPALNIPRTTLLLAAVQSCVVEERHPSLDICYFSRYGALDVIDIDCVRCLVGRIYDRNRWAVIDRSGTLDRNLYIEDDM